MDDLISRQAAVDAIKNTYGLSYIEDGFNRQDAVSILEDLPPAQPTQNNRVNSINALDTISRRDAIAKLKEHRKIFCKNRLDFTILPDKDKARVDEIDACIAALINLPSAQPERKTGRWIDGKRMKNDGTFYWFRQCDQCGYERNDCDTEKDSNFCPNCGSYNGGGTRCG